MAIPTDSGEGVVLDKILNVLKGLDFVDEIPLDTSALSCQERPSSGQSVERFKSGNEETGYDEACRNEL